MLELVMKGMHLIGFSPRKAGFLFMLPDRVMTIKSNSKLPFVIIIDRLPLIIL